MKKILLLVLCFGLAGCNSWIVGMLSGPGISETPYVKEGKFGYSDYKISEDTFLIRFKGNEVTSLASVQKKAIIRADEVTIKNGYTHYIILENTPKERRATVSDLSSYSVKIFPEVTVKIKCFKDNYPKDAILAQDWSAPWEIQGTYGNCLMIQDKLYRWYNICTKEEFDKLNFDKTWYRDIESGKDYIMTKKEIFEKTYSKSENNK